LKDIIVISDFFFSLWKWTKLSISKKNNRNYSRIMHDKNKKSWTQQSA